MKKHSHAAASRHRFDLLLDPIGRLGTVDGDWSRTGDLNGCFDAPDAL